MIAFLAGAGFAMAADSPADSAMKQVAQTGKPIQLGPPAEEQGPPLESPGSGTKGLEVDTLAAPDADAAGALGDARRGFADTLWQGTSRAVAVQLIPKIRATTSPTLQDLAYRLLASAAPPPAGDGPSGVLLALRAERLTNALGRSDAALKLLQNLPQGQSNEDTAKIQIDLAFLAGNAPAACGAIKARDHALKSAYWDQGAATCAALDGQAAQARLDIDLLRDEKAYDEGFAILVERALGTPEKLPETLPAPQPMAIALLAKAGEAPSKRLIESAGNAVLHAIAVAEGIPVEARLPAAEKAASLGALTPEALGTLYLAFPLEAEDHETPLTRAEAVGGPKGRAILLQAARDAMAVQARADMLSALLSKAPRADLYPVLVRACERMLLDLAAGPDLKPDSIDIARALYAVDRPAEARVWLDLAGPEGAGLLPLAHIVAGSAAPPWSEGNFLDLLGGPKKDPSLAQRRGLLIAGLLAAEGTPLPDRMLMSLLDAKLGGAPLAGTGLLIDSGASGRRLGGTLLAILTGLGEEGAGGAAQSVIQSVAALHALGLDLEARHLATDAVLAAGL